MSLRSLRVGRGTYWFVETNFAMRAIVGGQNYSSKDGLKQNSTAGWTSSQQSHQRSKRDHRDQPKYKDHGQNCRRQPYETATAGNHDHSPEKLKPTDQCSSLLDVLPDRHGLLRHLLVETHAAVWTPVGRIPASRSNLQCGQPKRGRTPGATDTTQSQNADRCSNECERGGNQPRLWVLRQKPREQQSSQSGYGDEHGLTRGVLCDVISERHGSTLPILWGFHRLIQAHTTISAISNLRTRQAERC